MSSRLHNHLLSWCSPEQRNLWLTNKNSYCNSTSSTVISCCFRKRLKSSLEFHKVKLVPAERMRMHACRLRNAWQQNMHFILSSINLCTRRYASDCVIIIGKTRTAVGFFLPGTKHKSNYRAQSRKCIFITCAHPAHTQSVSKSS
jgi:hypothetical protein